MIDNKEETINISGIEENDYQLDEEKSLDNILEKEEKNLTINSENEITKDNKKGSGCNKLSEIKPFTSHLETFETDYNFSREKLTKVIDDAVEVSIDLKRLATETEHPRFFEVYTNLIKAIGDNTKSLAEVSTRFSDILDSVMSANKEVTNNNTLVVGTSKDVQDKIEEAMKALMNGKKITGKHKKK